MFQFTKDQIKKLDALESDARFEHRFVTGGSEVVCTLIHRITGRRWHTSIAADEEPALEKALAEASPGDKPRTTDELAAENIELRKKLAKLEGADEKTGVGKRRKKKEDETPADEKTEPAEAEQPAAN